MAYEKKFIWSIVLSAAACAAEPPDPTLTELALQTWEEGEDVAGFACEEAKPELPLTYTPYQPDPAIDDLIAGSLTRDGAQIAFHSEPEGTSWVARLVLDLGGPDDRVDTRSYADLTAHGSRLRVITSRTPSAQRTRSGYLILDAGNRTLEEIEVVERLKLQVDSTGGALLRPVGFDLATVSGATLATFQPQLDLVQEPHTCVEHAFFRFGAIPWDMPPVKMADIVSCEGEDCIMVALAWIRTHHNAWRANQMLEILEQADSTYRSFLWGQPGLDGAGEALGPGNGAHKTSPKYWYGGYASNRWPAIKEALEKNWKILRTAETDDGAIDIRLKCPSYGADPANACFTATIDPAGQHVVKGWVNICPSAFDSNSQKTITRTVGHEVLHHVFVDFEGALHALRDVHTHGHGSACWSDLQTEAIYGTDEVRELATYLAADGEGCWHRDKVLQTVEATALFVYTVGTMVDKGDMWWWPKLADPTPQPPECVGDPGCLCSEVPAAGPPIPPDGDWSIDHYCGDHDGEATCVETEVNAGAIVGICTRCEDERGPGCDCNDFDLPCQVGECFGDDTWGNAAGTGKCHLDPPPSWACLADCQRLFNDEEAWCYNDHPGGQARCMDSYCPEPTAWNCAQEGLICRDGECVQECGFVDGAWVTCADLGYPTYFECSDAGRCEHSL